MTQPIEFAGRSIGPGRPCFVIAEAGVNHNGDRELALRLIDAAVDAGADAVKFQTFTADRVVTRDAPKAAYQTEATGVEESQLDMLRKLELSAEDHRALQAHCVARGILFLSTPFDEESANFLESMGLPIFKIPSGEITNSPFLAHLGRKQRPLILSTGMSTMEEVRSAVAIIFDTGNRDLVLLHCVSAYPAEAADANLLAMRTMATEFGVPVGYSDHTLGLEVSLAAVALGANVIEKHFTLDRDLPGPDHRASIEPQELKQLMLGIRRVEAALGHGRKEPVAAEGETAEVSRKSIVAARDIREGTRISRDDLVMKSPGTGLPPFMLDKVLGRVAAAHVPADTVISAEMLR